VAGANYPYVGITGGAETEAGGSPRAYGSLPGPGSYGTTLTRPALFKSYYIEQLSLLLRNYGSPILVGRSNCPIPLPFVVEVSGSDIGEGDAGVLRRCLPLPDLSRINDSIANGTYNHRRDRPGPLALFDGERVDYSLVRLEHYTGTLPDHFQRFVLFTNYQRYVDEFIELAREEVAGGDDYKAFVEPGNCITHNPRFSDRPPSGDCPRVLPQMPAYRLVRSDPGGITLVNIGVGPSNAKTITDHLAVLRPHCWLMVG
ncbi:MAG: AMP nucleosidase, partial [bacterium]|nr:AMP nucleosidase [bacterium]